MIDKERLLEAHQPHWSTTILWLSMLGLLFALEAGIVCALLFAAPWWLTAVLILAVAHIMHSLVLALHEAAHGSLCPNALINDTMGVYMGAHSLMSFSLYRAVHHSHHAYLSTERDEELWPFVDPQSPLWARRLAAVFELTLGIFFTSFLFLRSFLRKGSVVRKPAVRLRVWLEFALLVVVWTGAFTASAWYGVLPIFAIAYLLPALLAGNFQSLRKYIEHMGMTGDTVLGNTRSVVPTSWFGKFIAYTMFNIHYHGVHHKYAQMHAAAMPEFTSVLKPEHADEPAPFSSYWQAFCHMAAGLGDPRVGAQWLRPPEAKAATFPFPRQAAAPARSQSA